MATEDEPSKPNLEDESEEIDEVERCSCGYTRDHHMVSSVATYTAWGKFWLILMGVSSIPIRIDFECRICKERFDFIKDAEELKKYI